MAGDQPALAGHRHLPQVRADIDHPADHRRVHRVIARVDAHVMIAGQPDPVMPAQRRLRDRRQRRHRRPVRADPVRRRAPQHPLEPGVRQRHPLAHLGVEVRRGGERPARQERPLQVVVVPLDDPLVLGLPPRQDHHLAAQQPAEPRELPRQRHSPAERPAELPPRPRCPTPAAPEPRRAAAAAATCPAPGPRHAGTGSSARASTASTPTPSPAPAAPHRPTRSSRGPAASPPAGTKIVLHEPARLIRRPPRRILRQVQRPQLPDPSPSTVIDRSQPIRSATTVAGIVG